MNNTTTNPVRERPGVEPAEWNFRHTLYVILFMLGLCGNCLVLIIIKSKKAQRTAHHIFIMNLAVSDLCFALLYFPMFFRQEFSTYRPSTAFCKILRPVLNQVFFSSIFTVASMAIVRCYAIVKPYQPQLTQKHALIWVLVIWLLSYLAVTPAVIYGKSHAVFSGCYVHWPSIEHGRAFFLFAFTFQYVVPMLVTAICYIWIGVDICRTSRARQNFVGRVGNDGTQYRNRRAENLRVIKSLAVIVVVFALLMLPKHLFQFCFHWGVTAHHVRVCRVLLVISDSCIIVHACLDPFLYGAVLTSLRQDFKRLMGRIFCFWRPWVLRFRAAVGDSTRRSNAQSPDSRLETFQLSSYHVNSSTVGPSVEREARRPIDGEEAVGSLDTNHRSVPRTPN